MTVKDLYDLIDQIAPFETQADFDNSGLLVGSASQEITGVLFALDLTEQVIDEAAARGVTHCHSSSADDQSDSFPYR